MKAIAVLISNGGSGTNLQAIIDGIESGKIKGKISVVISDSEDAYGLIRAKNHGLPTYISKKKEDLIPVLTRSFPTDYIALAGWRQIIPASFIEFFENRILNLHPGLIPDTFDGIAKNPDGTDGVWNRGKFTEKAIKNFFDQNATYAGSTIHFLSKQFDFGPILARCYEKVLPTDDVESLYSRLKQKENKMYQDVLAKLCK